jgi:hypothetical protein
MSSSASSISIPIWGNTGITYEDVYAMAITAAISAFVLRGGYILPRGLTAQETFTTVGLTVGSFLAIKQIMAALNSKTPL